MALEPDQERLLIEMAEAARKVDRHAQTWTLCDVDTGEALQGPWGTRRVLGRDVLALHDAGLLDNTRMNYVSGYDYVVNSAGFAHALELRARVVAPVDNAGASGWDAVDKAVEKLRRLTVGAGDANDVKGVGHQAITVLEVLGRTAFHPDRHLPEGEPVPAVNDAKRRIGFVIDAAAGKRFEHVRKSSAQPTSRPMRSSTGPTRT